MLDFLRYQSTCVSLRVPFTRALSVRIKVSPRVISLVPSFVRFSTRNALPECKSWEQWREGERNGEKGRAAREEKENTFRYL